MKISEVMSSLMAAYDDWSKIGFLGNPNFVRVDDTVTWPNRRIGNFAEHVTLEYVMDLEANRQFTFQIMDDNAIVQMFYAFDSRTDDLKSASLAYYKGVEEDNLEDALFNDEEVMMPWLRLDYDPMNSGGILHGECHLHLSGFPNSRIFIAGLPSPCQFIELVFAWIYPDRYKEHRLESRGGFRDRREIERVNLKTFVFAENPDAQSVMHFSVPRIKTPRGFAPAG